MSTFLQLAAKLRQETTDSGTGPTTVLSQTGELGRMVQWIVDAWLELQQERDCWLWMRKSFTVPSVASTEGYAYNATSLVDTVSLAAVTRFSMWYPNCFKAYLLSDGVGAEYPLTYLTWDRFRRIYHYGTQTDGQPVHVSISPTQTFTLGPKPSAVYTVGGDYQLGPQTLAADADTPEMPARFHNLIVYEAMLKYGGNRVAPEAMMRAASEGGRLRDALERDQLPQLTWGKSLA